MSSDTRVTHVIQVRANPRTENVDFVAQEPAAAAEPGGHVRALLSAPLQAAPASEPDPRGKSMLLWAPLYFPAPAKVNLWGRAQFEEALLRHYALVEVVHGPRTGGSALSHYARQLRELDDEALTRRYVEDRKRIIGHMIGLIGRRFAHTGFHLQAQTLHAELDALSAEELLAEHQRLVGPATPRKRPPSCDKAAALGETLVRAQYLSIDFPGDGPRVEVDLRAFEVGYQDRNGDIHVVLTPKENHPRAKYTFFRG